MMRSSSLFIISTPHTQTRDSTEPITKPQLQYILDFIDIVKDRIRRRSHMPNLKNINRSSNTNSETMIPTTPNLNTTVITLSTTNNNDKEPSQYKDLLISPLLRIFQKTKKVELPIFTLEEIKTHCHREDIWMVINNKVYDITVLMKNHPGGDEVLLDCGGVDATDPFIDVGHSEAAFNMLEPVLIGVVDPRQVTNSSRSINCDLFWQKKPEEKKLIHLSSTIMFLLLAVIAASLFILVQKLKHLE